MTEKNQTTSQTKQQKLSETKQEKLSQTKQQKSSQTKNKKTQKEDSSVSKRIYERFKDDWVLRGPVVAIVKWTVIVLLLSYIVAGLIDYFFLNRTYKSLSKHN